MSSPNVLDKGRAWLKDTVGMKSGQIKSLEEPFLSLKKAVSEEEATTKSGYKRLPQSERVQRAIEAACTQAEDKFGEKTPAWVLWIREHKAIVGGVWRCVLVVGRVYVWFYTRVAMVVRALPQQAMLMLFGITLAFFGGTYVATLAAVEAFRQIGGATLYKELLYVHGQLQLVSEASREDDDEDKDQVSRESAVLTRAGRLLCLCHRPPCASYAPPPCASERHRGRRRDLAGRAAQAQGLGGARDDQRAAATAGGGGRAVGRLPRGNGHAQDAVRCFRVRVRVRVRGRWLGVGVVRVP